MGGGGKERKGEEGGKGRRRKGKGDEEKGREGRHRIIIHDKYIIIEQVAIER